MVTSFFVGCYSFDPKSMDDVSVIREPGDPLWILRKTSFQAEGVFFCANMRSASPRRGADGILLALIALHSGHSIGEHEVS
jgi:hypothetical protein